MDNSRRDETLQTLLQANATLMRMPAWPTAETTTTSPPNSSPPDFDFNIECGSFKSSFARSLSLNSATIHQSRSLDLDRNDRNNAEEDENEAARGPPLPRRRMNNNDISAAVAENAVDDNGIPPAIPARRSTVVAADMHEQWPQKPVQWWDDGNCRMRHGQERRLNGFMNTSNVNSVNNNNNNSSSSNNIKSIGCNGNSYSHHKHCRRNIWPTVNGEQSHNLRDGSTTNGDSSYMEPLPIDCAQARVAIDNALFLQMRADTLQWQLKQAESGVNMYRVVAKEMAHFIERFREYAKLRKLEKNRDQIALSGSLYQGPVGADNINRNASDTSLSYLRTRSSTNLQNFSALPSTSAKASAAELAAMHNATIAGTSASPSHTSFTDYTWRRFKKRSQANNDDVEEQLNEEAFRLARTIENLLHTQQPDLTQHRNSASCFDRTISSIAANSHGSGSTSLNISAPSNFSLNISTPANTSRNSNILDYEHNTSAVAGVLGSMTPAAAAAAAAAATSASTTAEPLTAEMLYLQNIRETRCSVRSSTDGSVHSTTSSAASSSSKVETDEDPLVLLTGKQSRPVCSSTEGESGFSSINSLQDVGIPLSSTLISNVNDSTSVEISRLETSFGSEVTMRAKQPSELLEALPLRASHPNNVVGLPLLPVPTQNIQHRWDSLSKTYRQATRNQRFSTLSNDDAGGVLWV